ncbi:MAG: 2-oxo acid dehydrogenase subunit E2 [Deltaproteobacteria bacterium]|nr:2-oxo acid dehydrogenase subunit E2 [Deltaproteobacteria bacterium]
MFRFLLPDIGEGVVEAEVQQWFVKAGDHVKEDQPLVEVMTDKATVTLPSPRRGTITKLLYQPGQMAKVHEALLEMVEDVNPAALPPAELAPGEQMPAPEPEPGATDTPAMAASAAAPRPAGGAKVLATPAVRAMARQLGVELAAVTGSGKGGRVTRDDLEAARNGKGGQNGHARPPAPPPAPQRPAPFEMQLPERSPVTLPPTDDEVLPLRGVRRRIAERMAQSKRTAVHFTFVEEVDVTELKKVRARIAAAAQEQGVKVTFLPFVVKAAVAALKKHPWLNASLDEARSEIRLRRQYHIGIASATEQGLVVPVVKNADKLSLLELAREIERLAVTSRAGRARPEELTGSTFTITSLGAKGGLLATPVINYPEVAILGVHRIRQVPVVREGQVVIRDMMNVSLSSDHRVVDGHVAAAFTYALIGYLEDPNLLFMEMV